MDDRIRAVLLAAILLIAAVAVLLPTNAPSSGGWGGQHGGIWIADYNGIMVNMTQTALSGYLRPGDGIAVVLGNFSNFGFYNREANNLSKEFAGVTLRGYGSLDGAINRSGGLNLTIGSISPLFTQLSGDYEVNGPLEFTPNGTHAVQYFTDYSKIVRATGRLAIAYPSGRGVLGDYSGPPDNWNYSAFARVTDGQTIETQGFCAGSQSSWVQATQQIWKEYNASGLSISTLSLQISLGVGGNGANASQAIACAQYWRQVAHGNVFFWWGTQYEGELIQILKALGR
jgi:hypothetical protein